MNNGGFGNFIKGIWKLFLDFIGFLFDIDFKDEDETANPFSNVPSSSTLDDKNKIFVSDDSELIEDIFGEEAADYISRLRNEVDYLTKEHNLKRINSILTVIPPQKLAEKDEALKTIDRVIESIYNQFDGDVILRPGKINVFINDSGLKLAEVYIDCYKPIQELIEI